jgi:hypothetical protein
MGDDPAPIRSWEYGLGAYETAYPIYTRVMWSQSFRNRTMTICKSRRMRDYRSITSPVVHLEVCRMIFGACNRKTVCSVI